MKNLPIIVKFLGLMGIFGIFTLAVALYSVSQMHRIALGFEAAESGPEAAALLISSANQRFSALEADMEFQTIATTARDDAAAAVAIATDRANFDIRMNNSIRVAPANAATLDALRSRGENLIDHTCAHSEALANTANTDALDVAAQAAFLNECEPFLPGMEAAMRAERESLQMEARNANEAVAVQSVRAIWITLGFVLAGLASVLVGGYFVIKSGIVVPLIGLQKLMSRMAGGDLGVTVPDRERRDEIGSMARAVQVFKDNGVEQIAFEAQTKLAVEREAAVQLSRTAEREAAAAQQVQVLQGLADGLERLAAGDLLFRLKKPFAGEYEKLRGDFNNAIEKLQNTVQSISANAQAVRAGATEITQASDDLSRRTEQQAASLEQTAAALDQITATVRKTAQGATEAHEVVNTAKADAERSGKVVNDTVTAMSGIEGSSNQISNIIGVIDEIAFQTNLLALNAGIEAARAGDAGRGFAVVATEVRALAQRSADAAKEIKALISASRSQVESGVNLVGETGRSLTRIIDHVNRLALLVSDIASAAQEQASGMAEVNIAVNQMDQVTQQNAAMVEQSTAASHALASESEELARLVAQFRVGEVVRAIVTPARDITKSARPVTPRRQPALSAPRMAIAGPAAAESWKEF
jgi:methyl-accepting chemotaxis protein